MYIFFKKILILLFISYNNCKPSPLNIYRYHVFNINDDINKNIGHLYDTSSIEKSISIILQIL